MLQTTRDYPCDLCGRTEAFEVPHARDYTGGQPIHICQHCGFVYVKARRSAQAIADEWSDSIFGSGYTAAIPAVKARQVFVAEFLRQTLGLKGKRVCDIGAGEGQFLAIVRQPPYEAQPFGIEPSKQNCELLGRMGIPAFQGTIEDYAAKRLREDQKFDVVTIMWTLENCHSCRDMLAAAHSMLREGGHVVVATGSRILVPFKKPLHDYFGKHAADTHAFRFSANTLRGILAVSGFEVEHLNRYIDQDWLAAVARRVERGTKVPWQGDDPLKVYNFFERWHVETQMYYA